MYHNMYNNIIRVELRLHVTFARRLQPKLGCTDTDYNEV